MTWAYIENLLGRGLHWDKSQEELMQAIEQARADCQFDAAEHIRIILARRNIVQVEKQRDPRLTSS
jgi:hypothetical protein